jgi:transposase
VSDAQWALIEPVVTKWRSDRAAAGLGLGGVKHQLRDIVNAIVYVNRTGVQWRYLPHDFPPHQTVYWYFAAWNRDGTTERLHGLLRAKTRTAAGRAVRPSAAIADAQSVKTSANVPEHAQGIDAGKRIKGRKRHIVTDMLGLILAVIVTAASVSDTAGGRALVDRVAAEHPSVAALLVDNGYRATVAQHAYEAGIDLIVTPKPGQAKGFEPTPRWPVERTFGWLMQHRRLARDYETLPERSASHIHWAMIDLMSRRLSGRIEPSWRPPSEADKSA